MKELAKNSYFIAEELSSLSPSRKTVSIRDIEQRDKGISKAVEIIDAMLSIQQQVLDILGDTKIVLVIDFYYLTGLIGAASRSPEFKKLTDLSEKFDKIIVYSSKYDLVVSITTQLLQLITKMARGRVQVASSYSSALQIAHS